MNKKKMRHVTLNIIIATSIVVGMILLVIGGTLSAIYDPNILYGVFFLGIIAIIWIGVYFMVAEVRRGAGEKPRADSADKMSRY